jgi:alkylated DNA repair dioxygenase AlkB
MFSEFKNSDQIQLIATDGMVDFYPQFLTDRESQDLFERICSTEKLDQNEIVLFGKKIKVPRLEAYYALNGETYGYSGQELAVNRFPNYLNELRLRVEQKTGQPYNALLINYYRNGQDSNGWHADNEKSLGKNPSIASLSIGAARRFEFKHLTNGTRQKIILTNGSLLHMYDALQHHYKHQLPKMTNLAQARLNLTFRWVQPSTLIQ